MGLPGFGGNERIGERSRQGLIPVPSRMNLRARPWHEGLAGSILRIAVCLAIVGTGISMFASYGGGRKRSAEMPAGGGCPLVCLPGSVPQPPGKADPCPQKVVRIDASDLARLASVNVEDARDAGSASADGTVGDATTPETGSAGAGTAPGCGSTAGACGGTERPGDARASGQSPPGKADAAAPASGRSSPGRGSGEDGPIGAEATPAAEDENREANGESRPATKEEAKGTAAGESKGPGKGVAGSGSESAAGREEGEGGGKSGRRKGREEAVSEEKYSWTREEWEKMKFLPPSEKFEPLKEDLDPDDDDFALIWDTDLETRQGLLEASNIKAAAPAVYRCFRFLRSRTPAELEAFRARREKAVTENAGNPSLAPANAVNVMKNPAIYRGQPFTFYGALLRKFQVLSWHDEENNSGVEHTMLAFCRDERNNIYAVLIPDPMKNARDRDEADLPDRIKWTGLFLQRWSYVGQDNSWHYVPLYVAWTFETLPPPSGGSQALLIGALALIGLSVAAILWYTQRQERRTETARGFLRERTLNASRKRLAASAGERPGGTAELGKAGEGSPGGTGGGARGGNDRDAAGSSGAAGGSGKGDGTAGERRNGGISGAGQGGGPQADAGRQEGSTA